MTKEIHPSKDSSFYVYVYSDVDGTPVYVGKGQGNRAHEHLNGSSNDRLSKLLTKRESEGFSIRPDIIAFGAESNMLLVETALIAMFGRADLSKGTLFNNTDGGDGVSNPSAEVRKAMSDAAYKRHGGERIFEFENADTGATFTGNCKQFAEFIEVDVRRVNRLASETAPETKSLARWVIKGYGHKAAAYNVKLDFTHLGTSETFTGTQAEFKEFSGVSASLVSGLVVGRLRHANGWTLTGGDSSFDVYKTTSGQWRERINPWRQRNLSEEARQMWGIASELFHDWKFLSEIKANVGAETILFSNGLRGRITNRVFQGLLKQFRAGFVPDKNSDWVSFQNSISVKALLPHRQKPKGIRNKRPPHKWTTVADDLQVQEPPEQPTKRISVGGLNFGSVVDACRHFQAGPKLIAERLRRGWTIEQAFDLEPRPSRKGANGRKLIVQGKEFESEAEAARSNGLSPKLVHKRRKLGWDIEQALGLKDPPIKPTSNSAKGIELHGVIYPSIKQACEALGISQSTVNRRVRHGMPLTEALTQRKRGE
ncbi:hypothetical protein [Litorivicinus lipolyticus]|uniref:hypothetical protein n=1 Tax=Litorivicinus lipolyticus TaxID=418701 RepID=UPI003B592410